MTAFTDWLADKSARRIVLVELVSPAQGTKYLASETYVTGPSESPANTVYEGVLAGDITIERRLSGPMGIRGGVDNISDLVIANHDASYDAWPTYSWDTVTIWYGDPTWSLADLKSRGKRGVWRVVGVESNDHEVRFTLADRYDEMREPIQKIFEYVGVGFGERRPLCYGYPKNVTPHFYRTALPNYNVHDENTVEDAAVTRYINQIANTAITIFKSDYDFQLGADPQGRVTADVKGAKSGGSPATWLTTPGECLLDALTRESPNLYGFAQGGSATTAVLSSGDEVSTVDDTYNGNEFRRGKPQDPTDSKIETETITDYDGATRTVTHSTFTDATEAGDGYRISGVSQQIGPLTSADCDTAAFTQLDSDLPYEIGLWIDDGRSAVDMLDDVLSPGAYHFWTAAGKLTVGILKDPSGETADLSLTEGDIQNGPEAISIDDVQPPAWSIRIGYDRNHTVESASAVLDGGIDIDRMGFITHEYRWLRKDDGSILADDPKAREVEAETVFTTGSEAETELDRLWDLFSSQRAIYNVRAFTEPMGVDLGSIIQVTDDRHGLSSGKKFALFGIVEDLTNHTTELELWG